jgi:hypothetical protein
MPRSIWALSKWTVSKGTRSFFEISRRSSTLAAALALAACTPGDASFTIRFAPDFTAERHVVSVFGVYRDGQMSSEAWGSLAPRISSALGSARCDAAYAEPFIATNAPLWSAVEDYARANGPTDELLAQVAPAAKGDLILVLTVAGKVPVRTTGSTVGGANPAAAPSMGGRGGMGRGGGGGGGGGGMGMPGGGPTRESSRGARDSGDALDLSASLFSVAAGHSVGLVAMEYSGPSADEAIAQFAARLAQALRGATCVGWNWDAKLDAGHIRQIGEP